MKKRLNIFLLAFPLCPVFQIQAQEKPNLVFIMADQWRGDALGCLGKEPVKTPCLDQLAREGVNFTNAVSSYPVSSPARGMLMTGMYPHKNKVTGNCNSANAPYVNQWGPEYEADKAIEYLNGHIDKTQPFALVVSMNPPHTGYELVPDRYKEMYKNLNVEALCANRPDIPAKGTEMGDYFRNNIRNYYACMTGVDENIGRIINELKRLGLLKNTIVVFTSDHGICMGAHEQAGKDIFYEESMRIPVLISWPEKIKPKTDRTTMIAFADLYPTLLSIMGFQQQIPEEVQTFNLASVLLCGKENNRIVQPYYYIQSSNPATGYRGLRTATHTFTIHTTDGKVDKIILFDRRSDPYQMNNIAMQHPKLVNRLKSQLKTWLQKTEDPFFNYL